MHPDDPRFSAAEPASAPREHDADRGSSGWTSEAVLNRTSWRERAAAARSTGAPSALEQRIDAPAPRRIGRAVAVPAAAGAVAFAIAVVIAIAITMLQLRPAAEAAEEITREIAAASTADDGAGDAGGAANAGAAPVLVHVVGEVARPGVVELTAGARVAEAIEAAGGARESAVLAAVNLARVVVDGEQILVPDADQAATGVPVPPIAPPGGDSTGGAAAPAGGPLDPNTADAAGLETLPRVGPALAQRILDWRAANGGFTSVDQLLEVSGIGAKTLDGFRELVTVR